MEATLTSNNARSTSALLRYWFIQYNPLFFFSSLCVLGGVFLVSRGLDEYGWHQGRLGLVGVVQAYELLLIAGAALLFRYAKEVRPAVILGILELFFLFDWTTQTEAVATLRSYSVLTSSLWVVLLGVKLYALLRIFRLRGALPFLSVGLLAGLAIAAVPRLLVLGVVDRELLYLGAIWYGALLAAVVLWVRPRVKYNGLLSEWGKTVLRRTERGAWAILAGLYLMHLGAWAVQFSLPLSSVHAVPLLFMLVLFTVRSEGLVWLGLLAGVAISFLQPGSVSYTAAIASALMGLFAWRLERPRLLLGAIGLLHVGIWLLGWRAWPLPTPHLVQILTTVILLLGLGWYYRLYSALLLAAVVLLPVLHMLYPESVLGWGIVALSAGFVSLVVGIAVNWEQREGATT